MDIREAIEKAGPGGRIKRPQWSDADAWFIVDGWIELSGGQSGANISSVPNLTATDWEVVQDEVIEVGDMVKLSWHDKCEHQVLSIDCGMAHLFGATVLKNVSDLIFIRKGPKKHVFEGAKIYKNGTFLEVLVDALNEFSHEQLNKTYHMELTEVVE